MKIAGYQKTSLLDFPGKIATIIFTQGCNFACPYCHNKGLLSSSSSSLISEDEIFQHLEKRRNLISGVCITGGEPTLQPDLLEFIQQIKAFGYSVKLDTNGTNPEILKECFEKNLLDFVAMDIKHSPRKYSSIANWKDFSVEKISKSIELIKNCSILAEFRTTICKELHTKEDVLEIGNWIKSDIPYFLQAYQESDTVLKPIYTSPSYEDLKTFSVLLQPLVPNTFIRGIDKTDL